MIKLSLWHCGVLYILGDIAIAQLATKSGIDEIVLRESRTLENWDSKAKMYQSFTPKMKKKLSNLEVLFGEFEDDQDKVEFINYALDRIGTKKAKNQSQAIAEFKSQQVAILQEYGMTQEQSEAFVTNIQSNLTKGKKGVDKHQEKAEEVLADIAGATSPTIVDKLDTFNAGYRILANSVSQKILELDNIAWNTLRYYHGQLHMLQHFQANGMVEEEMQLLQKQRSQAYLGNTIFRLCPMIQELSGLKGYLLKENSIAKFHSLGYSVIENSAYQQIVNPE
jgi:hypothetical protein